VFEHLGNFKSEKGKYSKRGNEKRPYWWRGKIFKYAKYKAYGECVMISENGKKATDLQQAERRLSTAFTAYNEGKLDKATEAFGDAEIHFRLVGDLKRAGDARSMIADIQRASNQFEQALSSYQRAKRLYHDAQHPLLEAGSMLSSGHIERQLAHLDRAQDAYQVAQQIYRTHQQAQGLGNVALALGHIELQRGNIAYATEHYQEAIQNYKVANDAINQADASRSLADMQRLAHQFADAEAAYKRALDIYRTYRDNFGIVDTLVGLARVYIDQQRLDEGTKVLGEALTLSQTIEYELGQADANLGLAEINFLQANIDQALIGAQSALQIYTDQHNALGAANANRILGEINTRRGQLNYANAMLERALRTYKAIAYRLGQAETTIALGHLQYLRGFLDRARQTLEDGQLQAHKMGNGLAESRALLGMGDIYYQYGQLEQARSAYREALTRAQEIKTLPSADTVALVEIQQARISILTGDMKDAELHLQVAHEAIQTNPLTTQLEPLHEIVTGQLLLTQGDFLPVEQHFTNAYHLAEAVQHPFVAAEAMYGQAEAQLARTDLNIALETFLAVGRLFQLLESTNGDGLAILGLAEVNIGQEKWDEAQENCATALNHFQQASDLLDQADTLLVRGLIHRSKDETDEALADFEEALKLYHQQHRPLGIADACFACGSIYLLRGDLEHARQEQGKAILQVERVMNTISNPERWGTFLRQYAEQYAQTCITDIRRQQNTQARTLIHNFTRIAGKTDIEKHLKAYQDTLPTEGEEFSEEELRTNKALVKNLEQLLKGLP
jgi:tetratricopeptide (TPR) repeat protein